MVFSAIGDTALVVLVPEADPIVAALRREFDPSAQEHMPAHMTVLYPFMPHSVIDSPVVKMLETFFAAQQSAPLGFHSVNSWPGTIWLDPQSEASVALLDETRRRWPEYLPYGRSDIEPIPHLTIGDGISDDDATRIRSAVEPDLPIQSRLDAVDLMVFDGERWASKHRFPLGNGPTRIPPRTL